MVQPRSDFLARLEERKKRSGVFFFQDDDLRRTPAVPSTDRSSNVVMNLKQRLFKLELQLKQKETTIE
jgi:uncharacterized protein (DUF2461 family)